jgi:hypothetical protein
LYCDHGIAHSYTNSSAPRASNFLNPIEQFKEHNP